jgi:hypothetical protein
LLTRAVPLGGLRFGLPPLLIEASFFEFGHVFRFEARDVAGGLGMCDDKVGEFLLPDHVPLKEIDLMGEFCHLVTLSLVFLRFEANVGFAALGSQL